MTANEYQRLAHGFASYGGNAMYPVLGLAEEAGEAAGKVAKYIRRHGGKPPLTTGDKADDTLNDTLEFRDALAKELGDVLWMLSETAGIYGLRLADLMEMNIAKLEDRRNRGVIDGEGDNR